MTVCIGIFGQPNVGKSTLFNRILGKKRALIYDQAGVTRDWQLYPMALPCGRVLEVCDTPGIVCAQDLGGLQDVARMANWGAFLWLVDGTTRPNALDQDIARWIRQKLFPLLGPKRMLLLLNKCEGRQGLEKAHELWASVGFPLHAISALHGQGMGEVMDTLKCWSPSDIAQACDTLKDNVPMERASKELGRNLGELDVSALCHQDTAHTSGALQNHPFIERASKELGRNLGELDVSALCHQDTAHTSGALQNHPFIEREGKELGRNLGQDPEGSLENFEDSNALDPTSKDQAAPQKAEPQETLSSKNHYPGISAKAPKAVSEVISLTVMGRPNAGKSTFINALLGYPRLKTGPEAGITTDAVDISFALGPHAFKLTDTAGVSRDNIGAFHASKTTQIKTRAGVVGGRWRPEMNLSSLAAHETHRALCFSHVVLVLVEATRPPSAHDLALVSQVHKEGRALIIGLSKWDLVKDPKSVFQALPPSWDRYSLVPVSYRDPNTWRQVMHEALSLYHRWTQRIATAPLNRWLHQALLDHPPPLVKGRRIKVRYISQLRTKPPTFGLFGTQVEKLPLSYQRYILRGLEEHFSLAKTRLRLFSPLNPYDPK